MSDAHDSLVLSTGAVLRTCLSVTVASDKEVRPKFPDRMKRVKLYVRNHRDGSYRNDVDVGMWMLGMSMWYHCTMAE